MTISTEKSIPFSSENHSVLGGNRQSRTSIKFPPESAGDDGILANANGDSMETGPRIYIPAKIYPHLGMCFVPIQLAKPSTVTPARGTTFSVLFSLASDSKLHPPHGKKENMVRTRRHGPKATRFALTETLLANGASPYLVGASIYCILDALSDHIRLLRRICVRLI